MDETTYPCQQGNLRLAASAARAERVCGVSSAVESCHRFLTDAGLHWPQHTLTPDPARLARFAPDGVLLFPERLH